MNFSLIWIVLIVCLAGFTHGLSGFGFGLVAMGLLPLVMDFKEAVALVVLYGAVTVCLTLFTLRTHYRWREGIALIAGSCLGVPLGVYGLVHMNETLLRHAFGGVMCFFAAGELLSPGKSRILLPSKMEWPIGLVSGSLSGAFNMGGPIAVAYAYTRPWNKEQAASFLQVLFGTSAVMRIIFMGSEGLFHARILKVSLWGFFPLFLAIWLGNRYFSKMPQKNLKTGTFVFLIVMGVVHLLSP